MNRFAGLALIGGFLAISVAASGAVAIPVPERATHLVPLAAQQPLASIAQPVAAPAATAAAANVSQRVIHPSQVSTRTALPPASAEVVTVGQASPGPCPPAHTGIACRQP